MPITILRGISISVSESARTHVQRVFAHHRFLPGGFRVRHEREAAGVGGRRPHPLHRREEAARGHGAVHAAPVAGRKAT